MEDFPGGQMQLARHAHIWVKVFFGRLISPLIFMLLRAEQKWTELNRAKVDFYTNRPDRPGGSALVRTLR